MTARRLLSVLVVASLAVAACGGSKHATPTTTTLSSDTSTATTTTLGSTTTSAATSNTTTATTAAGATTTAKAATALAGFAPLSATFVSLQTAWVLGSVPCATATCPALLHTTDRGTTWRRIALPATLALGSQSPRGVSEVRFANTKDGWLFGPDRWSTHDGGTTWTDTTPAGTHGPETVLSLEAGNGRVHAAVIVDAVNPVLAVASSPIGAETWTNSATTVELGAGPAARVQIVLQGATGWAILDNRLVQGGLRLRSGTWEAWKAPCLDSNGPADVAASSSNDLIAVCDQGIWGTPIGTHLYRSTNGGDSLTALGPVLENSSIMSFATPSAGVIVATTAKGIERFDPSISKWSVVSSHTRGHSVGFTSSTQGFVITDDAMYLTRDAGKTWSALTFAVK